MTARAVLALALIAALNLAPRAVTEALEVRLTYTAADRAECASDSKEAARYCLQAKGDLWFRRVFPDYSIVFWTWKDDPEPEGYVFIRRNP